MRPSSLLLGLATLLTLAAATLLLVGGDAPPPPTEQLADANDADPSTPDEVLAPLQADRDEPNAAAEAEAAADDAAEPDDPGEERADATEAQAGAVVRVVLGDTDQPIANAEVWFVREDAGRAAQSAHAADRPPRAQSDWPRAFGQVARSDAAGQIRLPAQRTTWLVAAQREGLFAYDQTNGRRPLVLRLLPDETLTVIARHGDGRPAPGVDVAVLQSPRRGKARVIAVDAVGADGHLVVPHFQLLRRAPERNPDAEVFAALLAVPGNLPVVAEFAGRPAPGEPVVLVVPPLAALSVRLVDHRGTPLLTAAELWVAPDPPVTPDRRALPYDADSQCTRTLKKEVGTQWLQVPIAMAGASLRLAPTFPNEAGVAQTVTLPPEAGGHLQFDLPLGPQQLVLAGRLCDAAGKPLGGAQPSTALWVRERDASRIAIATTDDGHFDCVLHAQADGIPRWLVLRSSGSDSDSETNATAGARIALPPLQGGQRIELGDVRLAPLPPLVRGRVVDDRGEPIVGATLALSQQQPPDPRQPNRERWRAIRAFTATSADDGSFALFGDLPPGTLRLSASADGHFGASAPLLVAGSELVLHLDRHGVLRGRAVLPPWLGDSGIAQLQVQADGERASRSVSLRRRRGGRFAVGELHTGAYTVSVVVRNLPDPLLVVPGVYVRPGDNEDARLDLDLTQLLFRHRLRAVDAAGQPLAIDSPLLAKLHHSDGSVVDTGFRWQRGRAEIVSTSALLELIAFAPGCAPQRLALPPGDHDVYLPRLQPAVLELPGARALCGPQRKVRVSVILDGATGNPEGLSGLDQRTGERFAFARWDLGKSSGAWMGAFDSVEVPLMQDGTYEVVLRVHATDESSPQASVSLGRFALHTDGRDLVPIRVPVPAEAVTAALARVDQQFAQQQVQQQQRSRRAQR